MADRVDRERTAPHDATVGRRDQGLRRLRRATAIVAVTAAACVGGVSALAAATRPGHTSQAGASPPAGAEDAPSDTLQAPVAPPTAPPTSAGDEGDDGASTSSGDDGQAAQPAPAQPQPQPQSQPAPAPPPVTSGGS